MTEDEPLVARAVVRFLHDRHGGTQREFARDAGVSRDTISKCMNGHRAVSRATLAKLAAAAPVEPADLQALLAVARSAYGTKPAEPDQPPPAETVQWSEESGLAPALEAFLEARVRSLRQRRRAPAAPASAESAAALWARLEPYTPAQRQGLVEEVEAFQSWELAQLLCGQSVALALEDAAAAVEAATLAVQAATLAPGTGAEKARREAYAWAHLGRALQAKNELREADRAFAIADRLRA